eukprot:195620_1
MLLSQLKSRYEAVRGVLKPQMQKSNKAMGLAINHNVDLLKRNYVFVTIGAFSLMQLTALWNTLKDGTCTEIDVQKLNVDPNIPPQAKIVLPLACIHCNRYFEGTLVTRHEYHGIGCH